MRVVCELSVVRIGYSTGNVPEFRVDSRNANRYLSSRTQRFGGVSRCCETVASRSLADASRERGRRGARAALRATGFVDTYPAACACGRVRGAGARPTLRAAGDASAIVRARARARLRRPSDRRAPSPRRVSKWRLRVSCLQNSRQRSLSREGFLRLGDVWKTMEQWFWRKPAAAAAV